MPRRKAVCKNMVTIDEQIIPYTRRVNNLYVVNFWSCQCCNFFQLECINQNVPRISHKVHIHYNPKLLSLKKKIFQKMLRYQSRPLMDWTKLDKRVCKNTAIDEQIVPSQNLCLVKQKLKNCVCSSLLNLVLAPKVQHGNTLIPKNQTQNPKLLSD